MKFSTPRPEDTDIDAAGYPAVRQAFNRVLNAAVDRLTKIDWILAEDILELGAIGELGRGTEIMAADTALYSRAGYPLPRSGRKRGIDRVIKKIPVGRDPLGAAMAAMLPNAIFSLFEVEDVEPQGIVTARDLLNPTRPLLLRDDSLADRMRPGAIFAGRFLDLGPWHIGYGIAMMVSRTDVAVISAALAHQGEFAITRETLHEVFYLSQIHHTSLILDAIRPMFFDLVRACERGEIGIDDFAARLRVLAVEPDREKGK